MSFGGSTIVFRHFEKSGTPDELGNYDLVPVDSEAPGCRHRPMTFREIVEIGYDVSTEYWRSTLPLFEYDPALLDVIIGFPGNDVILVDSVKYQIIGGVRSFPDLEGNPYKATIVSQRQTTT